MSSGLELLWSAAYRRQPYLARVCGCCEDFAAVEEVLSAKALKPESYVPEKVGSGRRFELSEAPARYAERPVLFDELSQAGLM
jgi:hypothetical protein